MQRLPNAAERHVAAVTAVNGMPASCRMEGLTKTMYAIVMNVVSPARISVRHVVLRAAKSKYSSARRIREVMNDICRIGDWRLPNAVRVARLLGALAIGCVLARAADTNQVLAEFRKSKPDVS